MAFEKIRPYGLTSAETGNAVIQPADGGTLTTPESRHVTEN